MKTPLSTRILDFFAGRLPIVVLSVLTGFAVILLYSILDRLVFSGGERSLLQILFFDVSTQEVFVRSAITLAFLAFGLFAARVVAKARSAQQALHISENRFETIANYTPSWENWIDSEGKLLWVNPAVEQLTGYTAEEALEIEGFPLSLVYEEDRERLARHFGEAVKGSTGKEVEFRLVRKDGSIFWAAVAWQPLYDEEGRNLGHRSSIRNITQRKAAIDALQQAVEGMAAAAGQDFFQTLTKRMATALDVRLVMIGELAAGESEYRAMAVYDRDDGNYDPDLDAETLRTLAEQSTGREAVYLEERLPVDHPLRRLGLKSCLGVSLPGSRGQSVGVLLALDERMPGADKTATAGSLLDIFAARAGAELERRRAESELRRREEKYRVLFERSADAMLVIDDNKFVDCNDATVAMLGYESRDQLLQKHPSALSPAFQPDGQASFEKAEEMMHIAVEKGSHRFEWHHQRANGQVFPVEVLLTAIPTGDRSTIHVVWRDITNRKRAEESLRYMVEVTSATVGEDFFRSLAANLATALGCRSVMIGELMSGGRRIRSLFAWRDGQVEPEIEFDLAGSACEEVVGRETRLYASAVCSKFPQDSRLAEINAECFLGTPLFYSDGRPLGVMAVADDKPMTELTAGIGKSLTGILAARTTAEIERVNAQKALRESEEKFRLISEQSMMGIFILQDDVIRYCNQAIADMFEYTVEEMMSWGPGEMYKVVSTEQRSFVVDQARRKQAGAGQGDVVVNYPWKGVTASGRLKYVEVYSRTVEFAGRSADLVSCVDVTEKKLAEEAIRKSQQMLQTVMNTIPVRVFWKNRKLEYVGCNRLFAKDAGLESPEDIEGKTDFDLAWKSVADRYRADDRKVIDAGMLKLGYEEPQLSEDGRQLWLRTNKVPLRDQDDNIIGVLGSYEDITERKKAAIALEKSEATLKGVLKAAPVGIGLVTRNQNIIWANDRLSSITGYSREELLTLDPLAIFISEPEYERTKEAGRRDLVKRGFASFETGWRRKDGRLIDVMINVTAVDPQRKDTDLVFTTMDITARKTTENALRRTTIELQSERAALDDKNTALKEVLEHLEREKAGFKRRVWNDVEKELLPFLGSMKQFSPPEVRDQIDVVAEDLKALLSQDVDEFQIRYARLTPREREICDLIKEGRSSKEISNQLNVSLPTVHKHRERIRRKLKIMNKDVNLNTYLHFR